MLELHCAHGYLLASFHLAADQPAHRRLWPGSLANRLPLSLGYLRGAGARRGRRTSRLSVRISATDWAGWAASPADEAGWILRGLFAEAGVDLVDVSTGAGPCAISQAGLWPHVSRRHSPTRSANEARVSRPMCVGQHHHRRPGQHHPGCRAGPTWVALGRPHLVDPAVYAEGRGLVWGRTGSSCPPAIISPAREADFPQ